VLLAFVPRLPSSDASNGFGLSNGSVRITSGTNRRLRLFAVTQIAASFVLLAGAGTLLTTLFALQQAHTGMNTHNVLALHVPVNYERPPAQSLPLYKEAVRRIKALPGVEQVAVGTLVPWREAGAFFAAQFTVEGYAKADGEEDPRGQFRTVSPGFFASLGVPILAGRDFNDNDRSDSEKVVIVSQSLAQRLFPNQDAVNRKLLWTDPVMKFIGVSTAGRRIVGVTADIDDENVIPNPTMTVYHPIDQEIGGGRLFVHSQTDPYALVAPITKIIRDLSPEQPVERATTLDDVRAEVLAPDRLNALVFGIFAAVALAIAVVGVAGVLAFSVSARTREFGVRLAIGLQPRHLLTRILGEGAVIAGTGVVAGAIGGIALARFAASYIADVRVPGILPLVGASSLLVLAAVVASLMPAARASRVDVVQALRSE
jgi:putative ABC transport system permease protein